jgi:hypothetical protein
MAKKRYFLAPKLISEGLLLKKIEKTAEFIQKGLNLVFLALNQ